MKYAPENWKGVWLISEAEGDRVRVEAIPAVKFQRQDIRVEMPERPFDLVLCRNSAFTYFAEDLQQETLRRIEDRISPGGFLVIGNKEKLPAQAGVSLEPGPQGIYWRRNMAAR